MSIQNVKVVLKISKHRNCFFVSITSYYRCIYGNILCIKTIAYKEPGEAAGPIETNGPRLGPMEGNIYASKALQRVINLMQVKWMEMG